VSLNLAEEIERNYEKSQSGYPVFVPRLELELHKYDTGVLSTLPPVVAYILHNVGFNFRLHSSICGHLMAGSWREYLNRRGKGRNDKRLERTA
jgi:hypothetical protein